MKACIFRLLLLLTTVCFGSTCFGSCFSIFPVSLVNGKNNFRIKDLRRIAAKISDPKITELGWDFIKGRIKRSFIETDEFETTKEQRPSKKMTYRVVRTNRTNGIEKIRDGIKDAEVERTWIFLPMQEIWVDVTMLAQKDRVFPDLSLVEALQQGFGAIEVYHSHPPKVLETVYRERTDIALHGLPSLIAGALPSSGDLVGSAIFVAENPGKPIISGIIHTYGVTTYAPTRRFHLQAAQDPSVINIEYPDVGSIEARSLVDAARLTRNSLQPTNFRNGVRLLLRKMQILSRFIDFDREESGRISPFEEIRESDFAFGMEFFLPGEFAEIDTWARAITPNN